MRTGRSAVVLGWSARLTLLAGALSLASCQGQEDITKPDPVLSPPPPYTRVCVSEGKEVFVAAPGPGPGPATRPPTGLLRSRYVTVNFDVLTAAATPGDVV